MSFSYEPFQAQQPQQDGSGTRPGPPPEQDATMVGQMPDNSAQQFQGGNSGDPVSAGGQREGGDAKKTLWYVVTSPLTDVFLLQAYNLFRMGELEPWIDENFVRSVWYNLGESVNVKMIRDKFSGYASNTPAD